MILSNIIKSTLRLYSYKINITDVEYIRSAQKYDVLLKTKRIISGSCQPRKSEDLVVNVDGEYIVGDVAIYTPDKLFILEPNIQNADMQKQSFVIFDGITYKVIGLNNWRQAGGYYEYVGKKHTDIKVD